MSKTATKLVWAVTPFGIGKQGLQTVADILSQNHISLVHLIASPHSRVLIKDLKQLQKKELKAAIPFEKTFLLEFVGRCCILSVPNDSFIFTDNSLVDVQFDVDFEFCAQGKMTQNHSSTIEVKVSSADQLVNLKVGSLLNVSYGSVQLEVTQVVNKSENKIDLKCKVLEGGTIFSGVKVHSPDIPRDLFPLLPEDENTLKNKFYDEADYLVVSGVKSEDELLFLKKSILGEASIGSARHPSVPITPEILDLNTPLPPRFLLKVDSKRAFELMPKVLSLVDGIFLSRSELGVDEHPHDLGILQKKIIELCNQNAKAIIVSSELMQSMRQNPTPTRAEVSDMANAMEDGADAVVLSSEVTHGPYSMLAAQVSHDVLVQSEEWKAKQWKPLEIGNIRSDDDIVTYGAIRIAEQADVSAIVCFTEGGYTAYKFSALRTPKSIIAITCNKRIFRQLNLLRAVEPVILDGKLKTEKLLTHIKSILVEKFKFKTGDKFVFVSLTASSVSARNSNLFTLQEC